MRSRTAVIAGLAALAIAGAAVAEAKHDVHVVTLLLPDGAIGQVHYTGEVAPRIVLAPTPAAFDAAPFFDMPAFDRVAAEMDQRMDAMIHQAASLAAPPRPGVTPAGAGQMPPGMVSYSYVSTTSSDGRTCSRSVQLTSLGAGQQPWLVSHHAGDCSAMAQPVTPATQAVPALPAPTVIPAKLDRPTRPAATATRT